MNGIELLSSDNVTPTPTPTPVLITTADIADGAITTPKLADGAVDGLKLLDNIINTAKIIDGAISTSKIADGAVTPDKISNNASEGSRINAWSDPTVTVVNAFGDYQDHSFTTNITLTVPAGKAYYYNAIYSGQMYYSIVDRANNNPSFYSRWSARLSANNTDLTVPVILVASDIQNWDPGQNYWQSAYVSPWVFRLTEGTYNINLIINGYSANTMNWAAFKDHTLQILRVF